MHDRLKAVHCFIGEHSIWAGRGRIHVLGTQLSRHPAAQEFLDLQKTWLSMVHVPAHMWT